MNIQNTNTRAMDPGLAALVMLLRFHGVGADPERLRHRLGKDTNGVADMVRCAKDAGLKVKSYHTAWQRLATTPLPAIAALNDGKFLFIGKVGDDKAIVQSPLSPRPVVMTRAELERVWDGRIVRMRQRAGLIELSRRFDVSWASFRVLSPANTASKAMLSNRDIGFVHPGQDVQVKVDTFPFTRYGLIHGRVVSVSKDAITRDKPGEKAPGPESTTSEPKGQELVYSARISLDRTQMQVEENLVNLTTGMAVTVEIKTRSRAVITYLLSPLMRYKQESLRER
jgi:hypothetical protein